MPQDFYNLDEAAKRLGLSRDKLTEMANKRELRAFMDRGTMRFRRNEVEELARRRGMGSDVELQLGDSSVEQQPAARTGKPDDVFPFSISEEGQGDATEIFSATPAKGSPGSDSDVRLVPQGSDVELTMEKPSSKPPSSGRLNKGKLPADSGSRLVPDSDSDVKLVDDEGSGIGLGSEPRSGGKPDSGVRLDEGSGRSGPKKVDISSPTDEINLDEELRLAEESSRPPFKVKKQTAPFEISREEPSGTSKGKRKPDSSEFDLAPEDKGPSDSVFDSSSEELALDFDSDGPKSLTGASGASGINLAKPSDKGVPLDDSSSEEALTFDLSDDSGVGNTPKPQKKGAAAEVDSSSEFELTLDDDGGLAPLEEEGKEKVRTDMVLPMQGDEGSSEELSLTTEDSSGGSSSDINLETSDFELALDDEGAAAEGDTGSEVIVIDEDSDSGESTAVKPQEVGDMEVEEVQEASEEVMVEEALEDEPVARGPAQPVAVEAPPADWGWWSLIHLPTTIVLLFVGFLLFEMLRSIWGYNQPTAVGSRVFDMFQSIVK